MRALPLLLLVACSDKTAAVDADGDGFLDTEDCDDTDAAVNPGASELCDGIDNDCSGEVDDDPLDGQRWYADADEDGFGNPLSSRRACAPEGSEVLDDTDCNDGNATIYPDAEELCDGLDNDCDNTVDEGVDKTLTFYADADGDGYGDPDTAVLGCAPTSGMVDNDDDCDDSNVLVNPGASESWYDGVDSDCAGDNDYDADGDGFDGDGAEDCDDADPAINPDAEEICSDGIDNNCDGGASECGISGSLSASDADATFSGPSAQAYAGHAIANAGDIDGDGEDELIVGAYGANSYAGAAYILDGPVSGGGFADEFELTATTSGFYGYVGYSVAGNGDLDGDGYDDVTVGSSYAGTAFIAYGPLTADTDITDLGWSLTGEGTFTYIGYAVAVLDDMDGDGLSDVAISSPYDSTGGNYAGAVFIAGGGGALAAGGGDLETDDMDAAIYGSSSQSYTGFSLDTAGDTDGDGLSDLIVGYNSLSGRATVFLGPFSGDLDTSDADATLSGTGNTYGGRAVSTAGDVNGDGYDDVLVGAYSDSSGGSYAGATYLFHGPVTADRAFSSAGAKITGSAATSYSGWSVSEGGDIDGDGLGDILIGAPYASTYSGQAYVVSGTVSGTVSLADAHATITGGSGYSWLGSSLVGDIDLNQDGVDDIAVGASYSSGYAGSAYVFLGGGL